MSSRASWHIPQRVTIDNHPWSPWKSLLFLAVFGGFCAGLVLWRATGGKF